MCVASFHVTIQILRGIECADRSASIWLFLMLWWIDPSVCIYGSGKAVKHAKFPPELLLAVMSGESKILDPFIDVA